MNDMLIGNVSQLTESECCTQNVRYLQYGDME